MENSTQAMGEAVFIRTDTLDYAEEAIPFCTLDEMVRLCTDLLPNLTLDKVVIYSTVKSEPCRLTLGFISASKACRPASLDGLVTQSLGQ